MGVRVGELVYFSTRCAAKSLVSAATRDDLPGTRAARSSAHVRQMGHRISSRPKKSTTPRGRLYRENAPQVRPKTARRRCGEKDCRVPDRVAIGSLLRKACVSA